MVQPAVAGAKLDPGHADPCPRAARTGTASPSPRTTWTATWRQSDFAPVYPATEDIAQKKLRDLHAQALELVRRVGDDVPSALLVAERLPLRADALVAVHVRGRLPRPRWGAPPRVRRASRPPARARADAAARESASARPLGRPGELIARYRTSLPFTLTPDQVRAMDEIDADLERPVPMQRLLQGDVGSGKTVVALYALLRAVEVGHQGALMAPTETLAEQHFLTIDELCAPLGMRVTLLTSSLRGEGARSRPTAHRLGRCADRRRDARADREGGRLPRPRRRRRRRAASLRSRATDGARRRAKPARPTSDRDADSADARTHGLRRPRRERARAPAGRPQARDHRVGDGRAQLGGVLASVPAPRRRPSGLRGLSAHRGVGDASSRARPRRRPSGSGQPSSAGTASAASTGDSRRPSVAA